MNATEKFYLGDIVETVKGAKFWGKIIAFDTDENSPGCTVLAIDPGFAGTKHVYPLKQLRIRPPVSVVDAQAEEIERLRLRADNLQARLTARAKDMRRIRDQLAEVHDNIEDEGDRVYFGSTNDADTFRAAWQKLDAWAWDDIMADGKLTDIFEVSRQAHARAERAEAEIAAAKRRIEELEAGLTCAMNVWGPLEPGDSRAVSNEYVAVAAILCGLGNDEGRAIIDTANAQPKSGE